MQHFTPRPYATLDDLDKIQSALSAWNLETDWCGYAHPGDVGQFLSNTMRGRDPAEYLFLVEDAKMAVIGVVMVHKPAWARFDVFVHPAQRGGDLENALITFAEQTMWTRMQAEGVAKEGVESDVMACDTVRKEILTRQGYIMGDPYVFLVTRSLVEPIPDAPLPDGFTIRHVEGEQEAEELGVVHGSAFGSTWQPGEYLKVMQTPPYQREHELVVVASDGRLAAFLLYGTDPITHSGVFPLVGCATEFQRRGLTTALMVEGMRRMQAAGMTTVCVVHESAALDPAPSAFYASLGFTQKHAILGSRKTMRRDDPQF